MISRWGWVPSGWVLVGWMLVGWTLFVWTNRVRNIVADDELSGFAELWRFAAAVAFIAAAFVGAFLLIRRPSITERFFAGWSVAGIAWWSTRGVGTLIGDFGPAFKVVHTVLALVTIALGVIILRKLRHDAGRVDRGSPLGPQALSR